MSTSRREFMKYIGLTALSTAIPANMLRYAGHPEFHIFSIQGISEFPMYASDSGLCTKTVSYLVSKDGKYSWGYHPRETLISDAEEEFRKALESL